jgi:ribosomal protein S17E
MRVGAMSWKIITGLWLALVLSVCVVLAAEADKVKLALSSAETWLSLIDEGKYADSWNEAAGYFKGAVKQKQWQEMLKAVRKPLGKVISREVKSKSYHTSLPGAPDGEYVVIQFETSFENKKSAIETVTPMKDKDGKWRVSGYFIK